MDDIGRAHQAKNPDRPVNKLWPYASIGWARRARPIGMTSTDGRSRSLVSWYA